MAFRADYHIHLENGSYTSSYLEAFAATARRRGLQEVGFSEHLHEFYEGHAACGRWWEVEPDPVDREHASSWWQQCARSRIGDYVAFVRDADPPGLTLRLGIEADYFPGVEESLGAFLGEHPWDYVLGSVHWLGAWGFDWLERLHRWQGRDVDKVYQDYIALLIQATRCGLYDVMAHPDLVKVAGHRPSFDLTPLYEEAARAFAEADVAVEVSTGGLRKPVGEIYPAEPFLRICRSYDVPITLASDAHWPKDVGADLDAAVALARRCGYTHACRFVGRRREQVPL
jgi:histidinol-phosphatase (PHP family)